MGDAKKKNKKKKLYTTSCYTFLTVLLTVCQRFLQSQREGCGNVIFPSAEPHSVAHIYSTERGWIINAPSQDSAGTTEEQ